MAAITKTQVLVLDDFGLDVLGAAERKLLLDVLEDRYGVSRVAGDRYAGEWPREQFRARGIRYKTAELDRSALYLEMLPCVNAGTVDDAKLLHELRGLERRRGTSGRDRIDHRPGQHDDRANAVAGVVAEVLSKRRAASALDHIRIF